MSNITWLSAEAMANLGLLALLIGVFTELTKNCYGIKKIPTDLQALVCGIVFSVLAALCCCEVNGRAIHWYELAAAVVQGLLAAFIATYGWAKLDQLAQRFRRDAGGDE